MTYRISISRLMTTGVADIWEFEHEDSDTIRRIHEAAQKIPYVQRSALSRPGNARQWDQTDVYEAASPSKNYVDETAFIADLRTAFDDDNTFRHALCIYMDQEGLD